MGRPWKALKCSGRRVCWSWTDCWLFFNLHCAHWFQYSLGFSRVLRTWAARIGLPIVPWWIAGLVPIHIFTTQALYAIVGENIIVGDALDETKESMRAVIFLLVANVVYRLTSTGDFVPGECRARSK